VNGAFVPSGAVVSGREMGGADQAGHDGLYPEVGATAGEAFQGFGRGAGRSVGIPKGAAFRYIDSRKRGSGSPKPIGRYVDRSHTSEAERNHTRVWVGAVSAVTASPIVSLNTLKE
jgi:hypothetical protein